MRAMPTSMSVRSGVMSVGLIYMLGRLAFGASGGLLAAALLAVWSAHVDYSQEARAYSLLVFLTLLASLGTLLYARALHRIEVPSLGKARRRVGLVLFAVGNVAHFVMLARYFAFPIPMVFDAAIALGLMAVALVA